MAASKNSFRILFVAALFAVGVGTASGQSKTGTTLGQFLMIEPSARVAAMGNAGVSTFSEASSVFFNPASAGHLESTAIQFTHSLWLADITYNYAAAAVRFGGSNTLLLTATSLNSGDEPVRTVARPEGTGENYSVRDLSLGVGVSRRLTDRFSAGVQVKYVGERIWHSSMSAMALDFGVLYQLPFRAYLGASLSNFGTRGRFNGRDLATNIDLDPGQAGGNPRLPADLRTDYYSLPVLFRVGMGIPVNLGQNNRVNLVVDAFHPSDNVESVSLGAEWTFFETFSARAGYQNLFMQDTEAGLTLGSGLEAELSGYNLKFDYAWNSYGVLDNTHRFTLGMAF